MITHYSSCHANYPEKPVGEAPQYIVELDIGDGDMVRQCVDCGACELFQASTGNSQPVEK